MKNITMTLMDFLKVYHDEGFHLIDSLYNKGILTAVNREGKLLTIFHLDDECVIYRPLRVTDNSYCGGYKMVCIRGRNYYLHRFIAECFCDNTDQSVYTEVNHINGDTRDNRPENLEWVTHSENMRLAGCHGQMKKNGYYSRKSQTLSFTDDREPLHLTEEEYVQWRLDHGLEKPKWARVRRVRV